MLRLIPALRLDLAGILKDAFLRPQMEMFLRDNLDKKVGEYTSPDDDDKTAMLNIVERADEEEWLRDLLSKAIAERQDNEKLKAFDQKLKLIDELHPALLERFGKPDSFRVIMASINEKWDVNDSSQPYKAQLLEVIADAYNEGWLTKLIEKIIEKSGADTKKALTGIMNRLVPKPVSNLDVVLLGSALGELAPKVSGLMDGCATLLRQQNIRVLALKDRWTEEWAKQAELQAPKPTSHLIAVHCVDPDTASNYARHEDLLADNIREATGDDQAVRRHIVWAANAANAGAIAEKVQSQKNGYQSAVHFLIGPADEVQLLVDRWLGRTREATLGLTPAFAYQPVNSGPSEGSGNIVEDVIIPKISPQLKDKFTPPEWEKILFSEEKEVRRFIEDLTSYPFGIVAINNFNGDIDREGNIPKDFQERITTLEAIIQDYIQSDKLKANNILRLAIIATTQPDNHLFQYPKGRNAIIARWRFVPVKLEQDKKPEVVGSHLNLLCEELKTRLNGSSAGVSH